MSWAFGRAWFGSNSCGPFPKAGHVAWMAVLCIALSGAGCSDDAGTPVNSTPECPSGTQRSAGGECVVASGIEVLPAVVGPAVKDRAYTTTFVASGGIAPHTFSTDGPLPGGLNLSPEGVLAGTPTAAGEFVFTIVARDTTALEGSVAITLRVMGANGCTPSAEVCDGADNDCDDQIDEDLGAACACEPSEEICDGRDNDCDDLVDEAIIGIGEPCGPGDDSVCGPGRSACIDGAFVCDGLVSREDEVCDGEDNDCDGTEDEGVRNPCGDCGEAPEEVCDGRDNDCDNNIDESFPEQCDCEPSDEVCDGVDNNCNGDIDEGVTNACGTCGDVPEEVCDGDDNDCDNGIDEGLLNACGMCGSVPAEVCDGDDNDCDGFEDEGLLNACGTCGDAPVEVCDGVDNDCDGTEDEGTVNACGNCDPEPVEVCDGVDNDCDDQIDEDFPEACICEPSEEVCDGVDNDCDDSIDEDIGDLGECDVDNAFGVCQGRLSCEGGRAICDASTPVEELCDGEDNDCDGSVDESIDGGGLTSSCRADGCVSEGVQVCNDGEWEDCIFPPELCDGVDNNCDGEIDNDTLDVGTMCGEGANLCETGTTICRSGEIECDGLVLGTPEICDGEDNDCDGVEDEEIAEEGQPCTSPNACLAGLYACEGSNGLLCETFDVAEPGTTENVNSDVDLVRAFTGNENAVQFNDGSESYSVLISSDGERIYNVAYGINGTVYAGFTVQEYEVVGNRLEHAATTTIPINWQNSGGGFLPLAGVAVKPGGEIWGTNISFDQFNGDGVWRINPSDNNAFFEQEWGDSLDNEGPSEYDAIRDVFWTIQYNTTNPVVRRYAGTGIVPEQAEAEFQLDLGDDGPLLGSIASDGTHLYSMIYDNRENPRNQALWKFGSGFGNTQPGGNPDEFARVRPAASITYHRGYIYVPDQNNLGRVRRVALGQAPSEEVCDGADNDCDGAVDEDGVCDAVDLQIASLSALQVFGTNLVQVDYSVLNRSIQGVNAHADRLLFVEPGADIANNNGIIVELSLQRSGLGAFATRSYQELIELPDDLESGEYNVVVITDANNQLGDVDRTNNRRLVRVEFESAFVCDEDEFEPNDDLGSAAELARFQFYNGLTLCGDEGDWFTVEVPSSGSQGLISQTFGSSAELLLIAYDDNGDELERSSPLGQNRQAVRIRNESDETRFFYFQVIQVNSDLVVNYAVLTENF